MFTSPTEDLAILTVAFGIGILTWGFFRAKPFGKLGILAWLQSVVLMIPWLIVFGLAAAGLMLNLVMILLLLVVSTVVYIILGNQVRSLKEATLQSRRAAAIAESQSSSSDSSPSESQSPESTPTSHSRSADAQGSPLPTPHSPYPRSLLGLP